MALILTEVRVGGPEKGKFILHLVVIIQAPPPIPGLHIECVMFTVLLHGVSSCTYHFPKPLARYRLKVCDTIVGRLKKVK